MKNWSNYIKKNLKWFILTICLILFIFIAEDVLDKEIIAFDFKIYQFFRENIVSDVLTPIVKIITEFGGFFVIIWLTFLIAVFVKNKRISYMVLLNLFLITGLNQIVKFALQRPRPEYSLIVETGFSFPSGHSMISLAFYGFLIFLLYKYAKNQKAKWLLISTLIILILLIGVSRIYLGVHFGSDVIGGYLISIAYLILYTHLITKYMEGKNKNEIKKFNKKL